MERLCGLLLLLVYLKLYSYKNLTNNILLSERFNHIVFVSPSLSNQLNEPLKPFKPCSKDKIFLLDNQNEKFYSPCLDYTLKVHEIKQLKHFYSILFNIPKKILKVNL